MSKNNIALTDPAGTWTIDNLIGGKVHIRSVSGWNRVFGADENEVFTVKEVKFRINLDGKIETVVSLVEKPGIYCFRDIEILTVMVGE